MNAKYGSGAYAREELRAGSAFIGGELGIPSDIGGHASYIDNWLGLLKKDGLEISSTTADAQEIVDMVLAFHPDLAAEPYPRRNIPVIPSRQDRGQRLCAGPRIPSCRILVGG